MKKYLNKYGIYLFVFLLTFCFYEFFSFQNIFGDPITNYSFSYAITRGEIPYLDFNTISTPLYAFVMAIGLLIYNNYLMFILEQSLFVTIMIYFLYSLYGKKSYLLFIAVSLFGFLALNPTYNFMTFFFLVMLLWLEKKYSEKDYIIGFVIGLCFLSKHTVGILLFLFPLFYYYKNKKKVFYRFLGFLTPISIFIVYLIFAGSFYSFIDLCFLGLFDFTGGNGNFFDFYTFLCLIWFLISIYITIRNKDDITNYYLLAGVSFAIPLFDFHHICIYFLCFLMQLLPFIKNWKKSYSFLSILVGFLFSAITIIQIYVYLKPIFCKGFDHLQYSLIAKKDYQLFVKYYEIFEQYENPLILSHKKRLYDISRNNDIDYYDAFYIGNFGYHGSKKMIEQIKKMHDRYVIIDMKDYNADFSNQFDLEIANYIMDHGEFVKTDSIFNIYYIK